MGANRQVYQQSILLCQKAMCKEMEKITEDMLFQDAGGKGLVKLKVYEQKLPVVRGQTGGLNNDAESIDYIGEQVDYSIVDCPWCKVVVDQGSVRNMASQHSVYLSIILGIFNDGERNSGYEEVINIIQRFINRFSENPFLEEQFQQSGDMDWEINDDQDTFPYTFGAITARFSMKGMKRSWGEEFT